MNYYPRHIGDYIRDAGHLTMIEHGAYTLLLDIYYATERGIPANKDLFKSVRAKSKDEKAAIDYVLNRFFTLKNDVWLNKRAEEEIRKTRKKIIVAKVNGSKGGRPKFKKNDANFEQKNAERLKPNTGVASSITQNKPTGLFLGYQKKPTGLANANQIESYPITNNQSINKRKKQTKKENVGKESSAQQICVALNAQGIRFVDHENLKLSELIKKGARIDDFLDAAKIAQKREKGFPYVLGIVEKSVLKSGQSLEINSKNIALGVNDDGSF